MEQRWITTEEYGTEYGNRVRYKLGFTIPLNGTKVEKGTIFITVFDEVFIDFDRFDYWFDREAGEAGLNQNRLYAGLGHQLTDLSSFGFGFIWQHRPNANFYRLIFSYSHNLDFTKNNNQL